MCKQIWTATNYECGGRSDEPFVQLPEGWVSLDEAVAACEVWCDEFSAWKSDERSWEQFDEGTWRFGDDTDQAGLVLKAIVVPSL